MYITFLIVLRKRCPKCGVPLLLCSACLASGPNLLKKEVCCTLCAEDKAKGRASFDKKRHFEEIRGSVNEDGKKRKGDSLNCVVCNTVFKSRNMLFKHLKDSGHQKRQKKSKKI